MSSDTSGMIRWFLLIPDAGFLMRFQAQRKGWVAVNLPSLLFSWGLDSGECGEERTIGKKQQVNGAFLSIAIPLYPWQTLGSGTHTPILKSVRAQQCKIA